MSKENYLIRSFAISLVIIGLIFLGIPVTKYFIVKNRTQNSNVAITQWKTVGNLNITGAAPQTDPTKGQAKNLPALKTCPLKNLPNSDYALVIFAPTNGQQYAGVATNGSWSALNITSMVHYDNSAAPGQNGNMFIAFHREPAYQYINLLSVGQTVSVQDRNCNTYVYQITQKWVLNPNEVTQFTTSSQPIMTLITCTPWWQDYNRIVWRAVLQKTIPYTGN